MSIARATARVLRQPLRAHVAWLPLGGNFDLGDFGVFSGGVFVRLGNVVNLGVKFERIRGNDTSFEFRSEGVQETRLSGGVAVGAFSQGDDDASLRIAFAAENSLLIRCKTLQVSEISELLPVAAALRQHPQWRMRYRVVHRLWTAVEGTFLSSRGSDANIEFSGAVKALQALQAGQADASIAVAARSNIGLDLIGQTGPLALGLFRVRRVDGSPAMLDFATTDHPLVEVDEPGSADPDDDV